MKTYVELGLAALLAVLLYERPTFLVEITNSTLGKIVMIVGVGVIAKQYGLNAGILAAIISIVLQSSYREGIDETACTFSRELKGACGPKNLCPACHKKDKSGKPCPCNSYCQEGKCKCECMKPDVAKTEKQGYSNLPLQPAPVTGTDQITKDRQLKVNALHAKQAGKSQANGQTNNDVWDRLKNIF